MRYGQALQAIGSVCTAMLIACQSSVTVDPPAAPLPAERAGTGAPIPPLLDTLAHRLLMLDFEQARLSERYTPQSEQISTLGKQRHALCEALRKIPRDPAAEARVAARLLHLTEERLAGLTVARLDLLTRLTPGHYDVRALEAMIAAAETRRGDFQSTVTHGNWRNVSCREDEP